jgi:hypothetical protein
MRAVGQFDHGGLRFLGCEVTGAKLAFDSAAFIYHVCFPNDDLVA